jgi:hypothetical protein
MTHGISIRWGRLALSLLIGLQLAVAGSFTAVADADAASVLCQKKKKLRVREDVCKLSEQRVDLAGGGQAAVDPRVDVLERRIDILTEEMVDPDDLDRLQRRVRLAEDAATAPIDNDRLRLERENLRIPGVEGEPEVTSEERHEVCALTRVLMFPNPDFDFQQHMCELKQNGNGTWTLKGVAGPLFCDATCF